MNAVRSIVAGVLCLAAGVAVATDKYAAPKATGSGADSANPGDLEALVAAAGEGDVIHLAVGDYYLSGVLTVAGPGRVSRCIFDRNTLSGSYKTGEFIGGVVRLTGAATVDNCLIRDNESKGCCGGIAVYAAATVRNCTIVGNHADFAAGGLYACDSNFRVYNTVVALNTSDEDATTYAPNVTFAANVSATILDLAGGKRLVGKSVDIGCYETVGGFLLQVR